MKGQGIMSTQRDVRPLAEAEPMPVPQGAGRPLGPALRRVFHKKVGGFTLIEALIVVAIMALLAAIALPIYQSYVRKSRRTVAKTTLLDVARREEGYYSTNNAYTSLNNLGYTLVGNAIVAPSSTEDYYNITIQLPNPNSQVAGANASFLVTATPQAQGGQNQDTCGTYTLSDLGVQANTGNTDTQCW
jgi:type IV pilus assembly protein PilE